MSSIWRSASAIAGPDLLALPGGDRDFDAGLRHGRLDGLRDVNPGGRAERVQGDPENPFGKPASVSSAFALAISSLYGLLLIAAHMPSGRKV